MHVRRDPIYVIPPGRRDRPGPVRSVLVLEPRDVPTDLGIVPVSFDKLTRPGAGVAEKRAVDELDGCRRAFDVQEDGADLLQVDAVRSGM
jgi:hypothetical protein